MATASELLRDTNVGIEGLFFLLIMSPWTYIDDAIPSN